MDTNKYRYCFIDSSYLIRRNGWACSRGKKPGEYNSLDIVKMSIQTISKIARDYGVTADKYILVFDAWSKEYQGYYRSFIVNGYKGSRKFESVEELKRMESDPTVSKEELQKYAYRLYENQQRTDAKRIMKTLGAIGIPALWAESFEFDDIAYMAGVLMVQEDKPSVIVTKDSDLMYCTTPMLDYFSLPTSGSSPEIITYDQMWGKVPENLKDPLIAGSREGYGSALYYYKALIDSLGDGHNDLAKTKRRGRSTDKVIAELLSGNTENITDLELFEKQLSTFRVFDFPKALDAYRTICEIPRAGHYATIKEFREFCDNIGLVGISDEYYQRFLDRLEPKLFSE